MFWCIPNYDTWYLGKRSKKVYFIGNQRLHYSIVWLQRLKRKLENVAESSEAVKIKLLTVMFNGPSWVDDFWCIPMFRDPSVIPGK